ncbi:MAG: type IV pilus modification PilV family protein, partial [Gemmatimonadales bacterium]
FTLVEVMIAIMVLTVGILGLVSTAALVTRMIGRGHRSAVATTFATHRMERLRNAACIPAQRVSGAENLVRGGTVVASNQWRFTLVGGTTWKIDLTTTHKVPQNPARTQRAETTVIC